MSATLSNTALFIAALTIAAATAAGESTFTVMTFNTGTGASVNVPPEDNIGYGPEEDEFSDEYYGNGLAWKPAIEAVHDYIQTVSPDIVAFQEMFYPGECSEIPEAARKGFICEDWQPGDPTVARLVLGPDYQIATHHGKHDKYLAVHKRFGKIHGCEKHFCLDGLDGYEIDGCGSGSRVGRAVIERANGETLTVVSYHASSGIAAGDFDCRKKQIEQIFLDFGDGQPAANGETNLILGDLNTDPGRMHPVDPSAQRWNDFAGPGEKFHYITEIGPDAPSTYSIVAIDHILSDTLQGQANYPGVTEGTQAPFEFKMFDHIPVIAEVEARPRDTEAPN